MRRNLFDSFALTPDSRNFLYANLRFKLRIISYSFSLDFNLVIPRETADNFFQFIPVNFDIFVNAASGIKVFEPAADLGICLAIVTSFKNKPLPAKTAALGEVGLLGEIRNVIGLERRIKEAKKLGFTNIISAKNYHHPIQITL